MLHVCTYKRGIASIIGGIFLILIILSGYAFYVFSNREANDLQTTLRVMSANDAERLEEKIQIYNMVDFANGLTLNVTNIGPNMIMMKYAVTLDLKSSTAQYNVAPITQMGLDPAKYTLYNINIPNFDVNGNYQVSLITDKGNIFTINYPNYSGPSRTAAITVDPSTNTIGSSCLIYGSGFSPHSGVTIDFDKSLLATVTTDNQGSFTTIFITPAVVAGGHNLLATDLQLKSASTTFIVTSAIYLLPDYGSSGKTIMITGSQAIFSPNSVLTATWDNTPLTISASTTNTGALPQGGVPFTVPPNVTPGKHTITLTDDSYHSSKAVFIVTGITLDQTIGAQASVVSVSGNGFAPYELLTVTFNGQTMQTIDSDSYGEIPPGFNFIVPNLSVGTYPVVVTDLSGDSATSIFEITPSISLNPTSSPQLTTVTVTGTGLAPASSITISYDGVTQITIPSRITSSSLGGFSATFIVPTSKVGAHIVQASDGTNTPKATFTITPTIQLSKISGPVLTHISVSGSGFAASSALTAKFSGYAGTLSLSGTTTTDSSGSFTGAVFIVPSSSSGGHIVTFSDSASTPHSATAEFTILTLTLIPTYGSVGSDIVASGSSFAANSPLQATFDGNSLLITGTTSTDASGYFSGATISIPSSAAAGDHQVVFSDASSNYCSATFRVTSITLNPSKVIPLGTATVTVSGSGFRPGNSITSVTFNGSPVSFNTVVVDSSGSFSGVKFTTPFQFISEGKYPVVVSDGTYSGSATFSVSWS